jgi:hypothetical protein
MLIKLQITFLYSFFVAWLMCTQNKILELETADYKNNKQMTNGGLFGVFCFSVSFQPYLITLCMIKELCACISVYAVCTIVYA